MELSINVPVKMIKEEMKVIRTANPSLTPVQACIEALAITVLRVIEVQDLSERELSVLRALWARYRRKGEPVERSKVADELGEKMTYGDLMLYRALNSLRDKGLVMLVNKKAWRPLIDPDAGPKSEVA